MWKEDRRAELLRENRDSSWLLDSPEDDRGGDRDRDRSRASGSGGRVSARHEENLARREKLKELQRSKLKTRESFYDNGGESSSKRTGAGAAENGKANGESHGPVEQKKKYLPFDNFGSFFGPSERVVPKHVLEQIRAKEEQARIARIEGRPTVGAGSSGKPAPRDPPRPLPKPAVKKRPVDEATKKALALRESRDYSFLDSDEPLNGPASKKGPAPPAPPAKIQSSGRPSAFPSSQKLGAVRDSRDAKDARTSRDARDGRDGRNARDARDARNARDSWDSRDANVGYGSRDGSREGFSGHATSKERGQVGRGGDSTKMQAPTQRAKESLGHSSRLPPSSRAQPTVARPVSKPGSSSQATARAPARPGAYPPPKTSAAVRPGERPSASKPSSVGAGRSGGAARPALGGSSGGLKASDPRARSEVGSRKPASQDARRMPGYGQQRPNVMPSTSRPPARPVGDMQRRSPPTRAVSRMEPPRRREDARRPLYSDDEDSMDDFIDDDDGPGDYSSVIQNLFRRGRKRPIYYDSDEEDDKCMEVGFSAIEAEERRSARIAREEDQRELEAIEAEERAERLRREKKKRRL